MIEDGANIAQTANELNAFFGGARFSTEIPVERYVKVVAEGSGMILLDFRAIDTEGNVIPLTVVEYCSQKDEHRAVTNAFDPNDPGYWEVGGGGRNNQPGCRNGLPEEVFRKVFQGSAAERQNDSQMTTREKFMEPSALASWAPGGWLP